MQSNFTFSPERDEIVDERGAELSEAIWSDFERWSGGANTHVSGERKFSPLSSAHMLWLEVIERFRTTHFLTNVCKCRLHGEVLDFIHLWQ